MLREWSLRYWSWMIADGEPDRSVGEEFEWFAVDFWPVDELVVTGKCPKSAVPVSDYRYKVVGEITYLSIKTCVMDFGLSATSETRFVPAKCRQGDFVAGEIDIGLPLCVEILPEDVLKTLMKKWHVNRIFADLTPFIPDPDKFRTLVRDGSRIRYDEVNSTCAVKANSYVLHCVEVG